MPALEENLSPRRPRAFKIDPFALAENCDGTLAGQSQAIDLYMQAAEQGHEGAANKLFHIMRDMLENVVELNDSLAPAFHGASANNMANAVKIFELLQKCGYQESRVTTADVNHTL